MGKARAIRLLLGAALLAAVAVGCGHSQPAQPHAGRMSTCRSADLAAHVDSSGSEMSQPFVVVALVNQSHFACLLRGYPRLTAVGHAQGGPDRNLPLAVKQGSTYQRADAGSRRLVLARGGAASFVIGTALAYQGGAHIMRISEFRVQPPGLVGWLPVPVDDLATAPPNSAIPVTVTALELGATRH
ncbi:MAG: hypothetical protein QOI06_1057 [Nocardioidaceae bacterium]|jgi:hypothetical protein|nr:hypothetical protein [Nocardioidaceae bacterium]